MELIRWFVGLIGSLAVLAAAIQCLTAFVKLVKEVIDGVEKGFSIKKALQESKAEKKLIIPGTPTAFKEVIEYRRVSRSDREGAWGRSDNAARGYNQGRREVHDEAMRTRVPIYPESYRFRPLRILFYIAIATACFWYWHHFKH